MKRIHYIPLAFGLALATVLAIWPTVIAADNPPGTCVYVSDTGHNIHGAFLAYYLAYNGAENFGPPITEAFIQDGLVVQYFQRALFEFHPDYPEPYRVRLALIGLTYGITDPPIASSVIPRPDDPNYAYFQATGLLVPYDIKKYFDAHGGWELFGYPVSNIRYEGRYFTQYFQRARLEWYPLEKRVTASPVGEIVLNKSAAGSRWRARAANDWCPIANSGGGAVFGLSPATPTRTLFIPTTVPPTSGMTVEVRARYRQAGASGPQYVDISVFDQNSKAIAGAALIATVHLAGGDRVFPLLSSDAGGHSGFSFEIGNQPLNSPTVIEVSAQSGATTIVGRDSFTR